MAGVLPPRCASLVFGRVEVLRHQTRPIEFPCTKDGAYRASLGQGQGEEGTPGSALECASSGSTSESPLSSDKGLFLSGVFRPADRASLGQSGGTPPHVSPGADRASALVLASHGLWGGFGAGQGQPPPLHFGSQVRGLGLGKPCQMVMILLQVHLRKPCYDFYFL